MSNKRNKKTNTKMVGLCAVCEQYYKPESYTLKRIESGKDPVVICNTCLNKRE